MHILRADQGHNVLLYSGIHLTGKLDELLRIFLIRREQLNTLSKKHADELEDLGITINSDGTLDLNKDLLKTANNSSSSACFLLSVLSCLT